jgi:hypothetical protein
VTDVLKRLRARVREARRPPTREELEAREEGRKILEERDTVRVLDRVGPEGFTTDTGRDRR